MYLCLGIRYFHQFCQRDPAWIQATILESHIMPIWPFGISILFFIPKIDQKSQLHLTSAKTKTQENLSMHAKEGFLFFYI